MVDVEIKRDKLLRKERGEETASLFYSMPGYLSIVVTSRSIASKKMNDHNLV